MVPAPAALALALPAARKGLELAREIGAAPIVGWQRTATWTKRGKTVTETSSATVRAWELAALGLVAAASYWVLTRPDQTAPPSTWLPELQTDAGIKIVLFPGPLGPIPIPKFWEAPLPEGVGRRYKR